MQTDERARKNESVLLAAIGRTGLEPIAQAIGRNISSVSRMKDGDVSRLAKLCATCGLKIVPEDHQTEDPQITKSLLNLAKIGIAHISTELGKKAG